MLPNPYIIIIITRFSSLRGLGALQQLLNIVINNTLTLRHDL